MIAREKAVGFQCSRQIVIVLLDGRRVRRRDPLIKRSRRTNPRDVFVFFLRGRRTRGSDQGNLDGFSFHQGKGLRGPQHAILVNGKDGRGHFGFLQSGSHYSNIQCNHPTTRLRAGGLLPDAKSAENAVENVVGVDGADDLPQFIQRQTQFGRHQFLAGSAAGDDQRIE